MTEEVKTAQSDDSTKDVAPTETNEEPREDHENGIKPGQVFKLEDLEKLDDSSDEKDEELLKMYEETFSGIQQGEIISGKILEIGDTHVLVDLGFKSEGILTTEEFIDVNQFKVGDEVELFLDSTEDLEGRVLVSRKKVYFLRTWERLMNKFETQEIIEGRITRRIKGGFVVDLNGVDAFLPGSQVDVKPIRDFDAFIGQTLELKIVKVNEPRKNIVVSRRALIEKDMESKRDEILQTLEKGQVRRGVVKNITEFGVFIDLGGVDGLLHITDLSWGRVNHPREVVKLDQEIDVMILDFEKDKRRISLGLKQLEPHPWENIAERFPIGFKVKGKVVSLTDYGAFIEIERGIEGLIHVSEMSWSHHIKNPAQVLKEGDTVEAVLLSIEPEERKISLGLKQLTPDPWEKIEEKYPTGSKHNGVVQNLTPFGAFVELEEGVDGLVHISDLSWTKKIRHPSEVIRKGEKIEVVVLDINKDERRIALGHKQVESNPWDAFEDAYKVGVETAGTVSRLIDKGVIVTLPLGVDAFVPLSHLGKTSIKRAADNFKVGDELPLKVIEFDKENKRIVLSVTEYMKGKEKAELESFMSEHSLKPTTLKEIVEEVPELQEETPEVGKVQKTVKRKHKDGEEVEEEKATVEIAETESSEDKKELKQEKEAKVTEAKDVEKVAAKSASEEETAPKTSKAKSRKEDEETKASKTDKKKTKAKKDEADKEKAVKAKSKSDDEEPKRKTKIKTEDKKEESEDSEKKPEK
jgi:small subunit ribosomal protein S1